MKTSFKTSTYVASISVVLFAVISGCADKPSGKPSGTKTISGADADKSSSPMADTKPSGPYKLAWSEYPSWSVFGVADEVGLIDKAAGKLGSVEKKWNVDIVLEQADYDPCIQMYGSGTVDAVCITNMDILGPAATKKSVAILPTSTSNGADACVAVGIESINDLKGQTTYGLERSVSQYCFERVLESKDLKPLDFPFSNMDPSIAAQAMQVGDSKVKSIIVWNPFVMQTLRTKPDSKVLFDSTAIPEEIIDMVVVSADTLATPGGESFAMALIDAYYQINQRMADPKTADETLVAIGAKFSSLGLEDMKKVVTQTRFFGTAEMGKSIFEGENFRAKTMPAVVDFCQSHGITETKPTIGFEKGTGQIVFDSSYMAKLK